MTAIELLEELGKLGVRAIPDGAVLRLRPGRLVPAELVSAIRERKAELLALLSPPTAPTLAPGAVREALGDSPTPHALAGLTFDIMAAVHQLEAEIQTGVIAPRPLLVRRRPLGDWLDLGEVARLLRDWRVARRAGR